MNRSIDPEPSGETIEYIEWKLTVLDQESADDA